MSTISAGTTLTTALVQTGDTTGNLVIKTGSSNTTAMTISGSDQSVTIVGTLTANGSSITPSQWITSGSDIYYNTGNVGIGTSSPSQKLSLVGTSTFNTYASGPQITMTDAAGRTLALVAPGSVTDGYIGSTTNHNIWLMTGSTGRLNVDTSGNVGVGVSPSTWGNINRVIDIGNYNQGQISILGRTDGANGGSIVQNAYRDTSNTWRYKYNGYAQVYDLYSGAYSWSTSASGVAGNPISFSTVMTLDASGNLGIGTSSPSTKLSVVGDWVSGQATVKAQSVTSFASGGTTGYGIFDSDGSRKTYLYANSSLTVLGTTGSYPIAFETNSTERMRIDSSGNVGIGISSPSTKLQVNGNIEAIRNGSDTYIVVKETSSQNYAQGLILSDSATSWYVVNRYGGSPVGASGFGIGTTNLGEMLQLDTSANFYFNSGYGSSALAYGCRAWVNFNGTGTVAIRSSGNVSSITDNGTGDYTVNFTSAMPDANYALSGGASRGSGDTSTNGPFGVGIYQATVPATGSVRIQTGYGGSQASAGSNQDAVYACVAIHR